MYQTYVLYSEKFDRIYISQTSNIELSLERHNKGLVRSTKHYIPWRLIHIEEYETRAETMKREKELKSHKGRDFIRNMLVRVRQLPD